MTGPKNPYARSALTFLGVVALLAVAAAARWALIEGVFNSVTPVSPGACRTIAGVEGPEDFEVDDAHDAIFISSTNRRTPGARDGIYYLPRSKSQTTPVKLAGAPADFHPHGISLYHPEGGPDGSDVLMAINHLSSGRSAVEIFTVSFAGGAPKLTHQTTVQGGALVSPNDIAAIGPDSFYVTNDHVTRTALGRFAEDYLLWPHADLLFFNGLSFKIAVQRLAFPNGVLVSPDGAHLYVTASNERRLIAFSREPFTGNLSEIGAISIPARLDNISMDAQGALWVAGHPSLLRDNAFRADKSRPSPSQVFRVHLDKDGVPQSYDTVYADEGSQLAASSTAVHDGKDLFIGSTLDDKMLDCVLK